MFAGIGTLPCQMLELGVFRADSQAWPSALRETHHSSALGFQRPRTRSLSRGLLHGAGGGK